MKKWIVFLLPLVEVAGPKGYRWRSSLSRADSGGGACEVMWITQITATRPSR